jgi:hypothetical protein
VIKQRKVIFEINASKRKFVAKCLKTAKPVGDALNVINGKEAILMANLEAN